MAYQTLDIASGADGRVAIGLRYNDETMELVSVAAVNNTDRDATITLHHDPSGVERFRTIKVGISGTIGLPDHWAVVENDEGISIPGLSLSVSFSGGED